MEEECACRHTLPTITVGATTAIIMKKPCLLKK